MRFYHLVLFILILLIGSCARPYRKINMSSIPFKEFREENTMSYAIKQGVMYNMKNYSIARKEQKKNVSLVAVKIVNKSELPININDMQFTCGATIPITPIKVDEYYNTLKQKAGLYWLYSAGVVVYPRPPKGSKKFIPLPFGLPIAAANFGIAYKANKKFKTDIQLLDLSNKVIQPFDSIVGILTFKNVANCTDMYMSFK